MRLSTNRPFREHAALQTLAEGGDGDSAVGDRQVGAVILLAFVNEAIGVPAST